MIMYKLICQDCLAIFKTENTSEFIERHIEKVLCNCGGVFCGCDACKNEIEKQEVLLIAAAWF